MPVILATQELEIRKPTVLGQLRQKTPWNFIWTNKVGVVVHTCNSRSTGGTDRKIMVQDNN
jgi:hypothetical protein